MANSKISFLIATYKDPTFTKQCIDSIFLKCDVVKSKNEIIVYEDGSDYDDFNNIKNFCEKHKHRKYIKFIYDRSNNGIGFAMNRLVKEANNDMCIRIDSDVEFVIKNFDDKLISFLEKDKTLGLITCRTETIGQPLQRVKIPDYFIETNIEEEYMNSLDVPILTYCSEPNEVLSGFCFAFRKSNIIENDIRFCTEMKMYGEDGIFHFDILNAGFKAAIANKLYMWHKHHGTVGNIDEGLVTIERKKALEVWTEYLQKGKEKIN